MYSKKEVKILWTNFCIKGISGFKNKGVFVCRVLEVLKRYFLFVEGNFAAGNFTWNIIMEVRFYLIATLEKYLLFFKMKRGKCDLLIFLRMWFLQSSNSLCGHRNMYIMCLLFIIESQSLVTVMNKLID